ncbi:MAG: Smr/MutS family protein [Oscillospiraceae bacterium]|nr:Smr/MutS family protein [Oscillospiraceae bacterium]
MGGADVEQGIKILDLHGCTVYQAQIALDAALKKSRGVYRIRVVHGYHGGTAIRDLVRKEYAKRQGVIRIESGLNQGETDLVLKEWY